MRRILFLLALGLSIAVHAQDPNLQRGFAPGKVYDFLGLDSVSLMNGNLNVRIPLGQTYSVGPVLEYQFMLAYNSKAWEIEYAVWYMGGPEFPKSWAVPETRSNAGFGWQLTLGTLLPPKYHGNGALQGWTYLAPDGSEHEFPAVGDVSLAYTADGSYLRLRRLPDSTGRIGYHEIDFPNGIIRQFDANHNLTEIRDRYGYRVKIARTATQWTVTEQAPGGGTGRTHTIVLENALNSDGQPYIQENFKKRPVEVNLAAFGASTNVATYRLTYTDHKVPVGPCAEALHNSEFYLPRLNSITLPDQSAFSIAYLPASVGQCTAATLNVLTLPTGGKIRWTLGEYELTNQACIEPGPDVLYDGWRKSHAGVRLRTLENANGVIVEKRTYTPVLPVRPGSPFRQRCGGTVMWDHLEKPPDVFHNTVTVSVPTGSSTERVVEKATHYFSAYPAVVDGTMTGGALASPARGIEYGLPIARGTPAAPGLERFLSSQVYSCDGTTCLDTVVRTTYLKYALEQYVSVSGDIRAKNPRVEAQRTVFNIDSCGGTPCYTDSASSDFDDFGHYRETTYTGNLGGKPRTVKTQYTPDPGAWLLNTYSESSITEDGLTRQRSTYTWDAAGAQKSRRVLKNVTMPGADDLLSITCRDALGYVVAEKWLGGDGRTPPSDAADLCAAGVVPGEKEYAIDHEYPAGNGFRWWHKAKYRGTSHSVVDEELDTNTGLVKTTRDSAGLATTYAYDSMGRLESISPPGAAPTSFTFRNASSSEPARVTSTTGSTMPIEQTYDYDDLGRLFREKRRMPDGSWALRKTDYRGGATVKFVSEWVSLAAGGDENLVTPTIGTAFEHDQFGRVTMVTAPDLKVTTTNYVSSGVRKLERTQTVATPAGTDTPVTVTETYDMYGKLVGVAEPAGPTTAAAPVGATVQTDYGYDSDGKLVTVTMTPPAGSAQQRRFTYDPRGLLIAETHPEKELPTTYGSFDARGHAWTSMDADATLSYQYDGAERLVRVSDASGASLKELTFGTASDCTHCNGKLRKAVRHNHLPGLGDHQVTETYTYGANGLPSNRETLVQRGTTQIQKFTQDFRYDELLALDRVDYPTCLLNGCPTGSGLGSVEHTRARGLLTQVEGFASISGYHPSGMVEKVRHETTPAMTDTYDSDRGMARPSKITFSGATACTVPSAPVISASSSVCSVSSGNQASISNPQSGMTYTWSIQNGTLASSTGQSVSFTAGSKGQVILTVTAQNACGSATSGPKSMMIPEAIVSGSTTIDAGGSAYVEVTLTGTPPWRLTWSDGHVSSNVAASPFRRQVSPQATTIYQLTAATDATPCSLVLSGSATITVRPAAPAWITAQATDRSVQIQWQQVSVPDGARYDVERAQNVTGPWSAVVTATSQTSRVDTVPADATGARRAYVYRVHTVAPDGTRSPLESSPRDYAVTATTMYPTGTITAGVTSVQAQHLVELRRGIDALRKLVNLPEVFASQSPPTGSVVAAHFTALLAPLDQARAVFGHGPFVYSGVERPRPGLVIRAGHITQLREVLK